MDIEVDSSGISGQLTWFGDELFNGEPIVDTTLVLQNVHDTFCRSLSFSKQPMVHFPRMKLVLFMRILDRQHLLKMEHLKAKD